MIPLLIAAGVGAVAAGAGGAALAASHDDSSGGPAWGTAGQGIWLLNGSPITGSGAAVTKDTPGAVFAPGKPVGGYDPSRYEYNGAGMGATERAQMYDRLGADAQKREAVQADFGLARAQMGRGDDAQADAIGMLREAALGSAPSVAQKQLQMGQDAAMRSQESLRASARGASGVALADYGAAANIAAGQQATNAQQGLVRAQEMAEARGALMSGTTAARGQSIQAAGLEGSWSQGNAALQMQQREANDRRDAAMRAAAEGVAGQQGTMNLAQQQAMQRAYEEQQQREAAARAGNNASSERVVGMVVGGLSGAANSMGAAYSPKPPPTGGK